MTILARVSCALLAACSAGTTASSHAELGLASGDDGDDFCAEPVAQVPLDAPPYVPDPLSDLVLAGALTPDGTQVQFVGEPSATIWTAQLVVDLGGPLDGEPDQRTWADVTSHGNRLRVITYWTPKAYRNPRGYLVLDAGRRSLDEVELIEELQIRLDNGGNATIAPLGFELVAEHGGVELDQKPAGAGYAAPPGSCAEAALVHYGPIPFGMPPIHPPIVHGCIPEHCELVMLAWIHVHHNVWRADQMFELMEGLTPLQRSFVWGQPGLDQNKDPIGAGDGADPSSPEYWYGPFSNHRFLAIKQAIEKYWRILRTAETADGAIDIRLQCPYGYPENACVGGPYGHHFVKGWVNICNNALVDGKNSFGGDLLASVTATVRHELLHHVFVKFKAGTRALKDTFTHGHGSSCILDIQTEVINGEADVRELATYVAPDGEGCWHQDKALQAIETHALFAAAVGEMVKSGEMWWWPEPAPPTPQPPQCEGDIGCLCYETQLAEEPNGDYTSQHWCPDSEGSQVTCVETAVNAGAIVGICKSCDAERGPGCDCNDHDLPCDVGTCFGDDTFGLYAGTGKCYLEPPPSWACLADCAKLFNDPQAWCYHDYPGPQARCFDSGCTRPMAYNCALQNKVCRDGACVPAECDNIPGSLPSCGQLGYPPNFECTAQLRCEYAY
jgi:hypothetical protein